MAKHLIGDGINALKGVSGVIICDVGSVYAPKLTAILHIFTLLKDILNISSIKKDNIRIEISSVFIHSPYVEDELEANQLLLKKLSNNDPQHFQEMYKQHPIQDVAFTENQETGHFHSDQWDSLISGAIKFVEGDQV